MFGDLFNEINENCKIQDIPATTASSEFAAGQYEINLKHTGDLLKGGRCCNVKKNNKRNNCKAWV